MDFWYLSFIQIPGCSYFWTYMGEEWFFFQLHKTFKNKTQLVVQQPETFLKQAYVVCCVDQLFLFVCLC